MSRIRSISLQGSALQVTLLICLFCSGCGTGTELTPTPDHNKPVSTKGADAAPENNHNGGSTNNDNETPPESSGNAGQKTGHKGDHQDHSHASNDDKDTVETRHLAQQKLTRPELQDDPSDKERPSPSGDPVKDSCIESITTTGDSTVNRTLYFYDANRNLKARQIIDPSSERYFQTMYDYDEDGRLSQIRSLYQGVETYVHEYSYNEEGLLFEYKQSEWRIPNYGISTNLQVKQEMSHIHFLYDEAGQALGQTKFFGQQPGMSTSYELNEEGQRTRHIITFRQNKPDPQTGFQQVINVVSELADYQYDTAGHVTTILYSRPPAEPEEDTLDKGSLKIEYQQDRPVHEVRRPGKQGDENWTLQRQFDEEGRLLKVIKTTNSVTTETTYTYKN